MGRRRPDSKHPAADARDARDAFLAQAREHAPYLGVEADGNRFVIATWDRHMGKHLFIKQGRPEFRVLHRAVTVMQSLLGDEAVADGLFVDVGANIGTSTISALASQGFGSAVCCEPEEENYRLLRANLALNDLEERTTTRRVAVSDRTGTSNLVVTGGPAGKSQIAVDPERIREKKVARAARRLEDPTVELPEMSVTEVETVTLDGLTSDGVIQPDRLGMVWIDAEGHEGHILRGAPSLTERGVPIVFEFHPIELEANGTREVAHEIAEACYTHFVDMRRQDPDHERFGLQTIGGLRGFAERFLDPEKSASYTDLLLLRLDAAQADLGAKLPELVATRLRQAAGGHSRDAREVRAKKARRSRRLPRSEPQPAAPDPSQRSEEPVIAFVHIERAAGATVRLIFADAFSDAAVRDAGHYFKNPDPMAEKVAWMPKRGWQKWRRRGGRVVAGHVPYGLYRDHLPTDTRYVTFLREPVDRVLSHYHALIHSRSGPGEREGPTAESLEQALVKMRIPQLSNLATRYLCGDPAPLGPLPSGALDDAKANLRDFAFVGIKEQFDESIVLLQRTLGRDLNPHLNRHVSVDRPSIDDIADDERALIVEHNQLDAKLYTFAKRLLEDAISSAEGEFAAEAEALRAASAAANEEATRKALDWLDRELPTGTSKSKHSMLGQAKLAGIPIPALKHGLNLLSVRRELGDDGQLIWSRPG